MEPESGESLAHENAESSSEEIREGSESEEASARPRTSRRRSARGAKRTKAPMDGEGCGCGGGRAKKCTCDSGCSSYGKKMDRNDALTPQEYLAACDLGIQGRSRSYIRARLDAADRLDKKCGASGIAENKKCNVGTGSSGHGSSLGNALKVIGAGAALGAAGVAGVAMYQRHQRNMQTAKSAVKSEAKRALPESGARRRRREVGAAAQPPTVQRRARRQGKVMRLNSMYADGFNVNTTLLGV